ncbi:MAG: hypothetical protein AABZ53_15000 [Planctomycetota bacterium]
MSHRAQQVVPFLKLVASGEPGPTPDATAQDRQAVARANVESSTIDSVDARWTFAVRVAASLEGGRTGLLRPDRRRELVVKADELGLRAFDANLVIAIVQDAAREGRALSRQTQDRLAMVRPASESSGEPLAGPLLLAALTLALIGVLALRSFVLG